MSILRESIHNEVSKIGKSIGKETRSVVAEQEGNWEQEYHPLGASSVNVLEVSDSCGCIVCEHAKKPLSCKH